MQKWLKLDFNQLFMTKQKPRYDHRRTHVMRWCVSWPMLNIKTFIVPFRCYIYLAQMVRVAPPKIRCIRFNTPCNFTNIIMMWSLLCVVSEVFSGKTSRKVFFGKTCREKKSKSYNYKYSNDVNIDLLKLNFFKHKWMNVDWVMLRTYGQCSKNF